MTLTKEEDFCVRQLMKKGYQTRTIAQILGCDVLALHNYIKAMVKAEPETAPPRKEKRAIPHYDDPRSAEIGSRLLLEALHRYFEKREAA